MTRPDRVVASLCAAALLAVPGIVLAEPTSAASTSDLERTAGHTETRTSARLPGGFTDAVVGEVPLPTAMGWTPDGRMLVTAKAGQLVVIAEGEPNHVALDISDRVCNERELGLVGLAVDPAFEDNGFVYLYWSRHRGGACGEVGGLQPVNQVSRFVLPDDSTIDPSSEQVVLSNITSNSPHHVGGDLEFGADGLLYVTVGDGVCALNGSRGCGWANTNSQDPSVPQGKILRVRRSGLPAPSNPFAGEPGARRCTDPAGVPQGAGPCAEIFALGLRNPFRFARKPGTSTFHVNDVGQNVWEEVNLLRKGENYGWNAREGDCVRASTTSCAPVEGYTDPIHSYVHQNGCGSITGGAFVPDGVWPGLDGAYLFADYTCGKVWRLDRLDDGRYRRSLFASDLAGPVHLRFGPHDGGQALYYLSIFSGTVRRISPTTGNIPPTAAFSYVPDGYVVTFSGADSADGDQGDTVESWHWDFGDGTTLETTGPEVVHEYAAAGEYQASLTVTDSHGAVSSPFAGTVHAGDHPPELTITGPSTESRFSVGEPFTVAATATDPEEGDLTDSIAWTILRRHGNHVHPYQDDVVGGSVSDEYPDPEDLWAAADSHLVARATVTDSNGHQSTVSQVLLPREVTVRLVTRPRGGVVRIGGERRSTPATVTSWAGHVFRMGVPDQRIDGTPLTFDSWSDGGPQTHNVTTPDTETLYVARFRRP